MKRYFLLFFASLILNFNASAQLYPTKIGSYNIQNDNNDLFFYADTCINNKVYKVAGYSKSYSKYNVLVYRYYWFLRIDSPRIWVYYPYLNTEYLMYDFSVKTGDTIKIRPPKIFHINGKIKIDSVLAGDTLSKIVSQNTLEYFNGVPRKTIFFVDDTLKWMEGFGSMHSSFYDPFGLSRFFNFSKTINFIGCRINDSFHTIGKSFSSSYYDSNGILQFYSFKAKDTSEFHCKCFFNCVFDYFERDWYVRTNCNGSKDTVMLICNPCDSPHKYTRMYLQAEKSSYKCRDTIRIHPNITYLPPTAILKWLGDSVFYAWKPYEGTVKTSMQVILPDTGCNQILNGGSGYYCDYCRDSTYKLSVKSDKPRDTFYCPDSIKLRSKILVVSGNSDSSLKYRRLTPLPNDYSVSPYIIKYIVENTACYDTITTDTLVLICKNSIDALEHQKLRLFVNESELIVDVLENLNNSKIALYNDLGALVFTKNILQNRESIDLSALPNGVYNCTIHDQGAFIVNYRFLKR